MASRRDNPPRPAKPRNVPGPGSVPKPPRPIFKLEKKGGGSGNFGRTRRSGRK